MHQMSLCLYIWGVLVAHSAWDCKTGNISQNPTPPKKKNPKKTSFPFAFPISPQNLLFLYRAIVLSTKSCFLDLSMKIMFFTSKSKQWMTTVWVTGTPFQRVHPRMLLGSVGLYLNKCSVEVVQTCSESLQVKLCQFLWHLSVNGLRLYWIMFLL